MDNENNKNKGHSKSNALARIGAFSIIFGLFILIIIYASFLVIPNAFWEYYFEGFISPDVASAILVECFLIFLVITSIFLFDSINLVNIKHKWLAKAIWTIGISSIIASSVGYYQSNISEKANGNEIGLNELDTFNGMWNVSFINESWEYNVERNHYNQSNWARTHEHKVLLTYNIFSKCYEGFSDLSEQRNWFEIKIFPNDLKCELKYKIIEYFGETQTNQSIMMTFDGKFSGELIQFSDSPLGYYFKNDGEIKLIMQKGGIITKETINELMDMNTIK